MNTFMIQQKRLLLFCVGAQLYVLEEQNLNALENKMLLAPQME